MFKSSIKIGLVLSGGGVRSLAHAGFLQALEEEGIHPNVIAGTSGGALIGGLYANGVRPQDMMRFFRETPLFKFSLFSFKKPGIVDSNKYINLFEEYFPKRTFEDLDYPLTVSATNLFSGKIKYFDKGDLIKPLIASSALPPYFSPIDIEGQMYSDGGILDNFPTKPIEDKVDLLIGSFVNPLKEANVNDINSTLKLLSRVYNIGMDSFYYQRFQKCDYVFIPEDIKKIGTLDSRMLEKAYDIGYQDAMKNMAFIRYALVKKINI